MLPLYVTYGTWHVKIPVEIVSEVNVLQNMEKEEASLIWKLSDKSDGKYWHLRNINFGDSSGTEQKT